MSRSFYILVLFFLVKCQPNKNEKRNVTSPNWNNEVIYHVMQRSFFDSNGDRHGDLNGFVQKLDYLKELGVTTILFTPLYESSFYHNYFPTDYKKIDQEYGTFDDYIHFIEEVHKNDMKFIMDMETQYAASGHIWFDSSYNNPSSKFSEFIYYADSLNLKPEQIFMKSGSPLHDFKAWPGNSHHIVLLDLNNKSVKNWTSEFYQFWVDPNGDGKFTDGVDGFRIDHIMDDLDYKGIFTNMYQSFWKPVFNSCKSINPSIFILGEQSNWDDFGDKMVVNSNADAAFNFKLRFAIAGVESVKDMYFKEDHKFQIFTPSLVHDVALKTEKICVDSIYMVNFLENHDIDRWASVVNDKRLLKIGALLNLFLPGTPSIFYGQELGLTGKKHEWGYDVNHIPIREAFPWTSNENDEGNALWYKGDEEWWNESFWKTSKIDLLSLEYQKKDSTSLWNFYKKLIKIRHTFPALRIGSYHPVMEKSTQIMAFDRKLNEHSIFVIMNIGKEKVTIPFSIEDNTSLIMENINFRNDSIEISPFGFMVSNRKNS